MIDRVTRFARAEAGTFVRFLVVGALSTIINLGLYALFSRWIYPQGNKVVESTLAFLLSVLFNFAAHRAWTYRSRHLSIGQLARYAFVVGSASALQAGLFWLGHEKLGFYDFGVIIVATGVTAIFTFFAHKFFTFAQPKAEA
ncbi:MAG TPA: GtrA family protein [Verrucomicrobiae bacterium]|nr:GtrA family protein [Verrucomicrobiae bacterium]